MINPTSSGGETNRILGKIYPDSYTTCWGKSAFYCATRLVQIELVNESEANLVCLPQEHSNQWSREFSTIGLTRLSQFIITSNRNGMSRCQVLCLSAKGGGEGHSESSKLESSRPLFDCAQPLPGDT